MRLLHVSGFCFVALHAATAFAALDIPLTVTLSESVIVTGTPRMAVDVGGVTRYATYTSGSTTSTLTFTLSPQAGDVDLDGITLVSPLELNGGTMKDAAGNNAALTFTPPNTSGIKVNYPSLSMDFVADADGRYTMNGTVYNDLTSFLAATGGTFTRATVGTYFDSAGVLQTASAGTPRFEYDPITHTPKGILIEDARTNTLQRTMEFTNAYWTAVRTTPTLNGTVAPDSSTNAYKLETNSAASWQAIRRSSLSYTAGQIYTASIFFKAGSQTSAKIDIWTGTSDWYADFNIATGSVLGTTGSVTGSVVSVGNGWYRCAATWTAPSTTAAGEVQFRFSGAAPVAIGEYFYIWGAQLETGSFATSYIPTTTAGLTRATDAFLVPIGAWYNAAAGSTQVTYDTIYASSTTFPTSTVFSFDNTTINDRMTYFANIATISTPRFYLDNSVSGSQVHGFSGTALVSGTPRAAAFAVTQNYAAFAENGTFKGTDTTAIELPAVTGFTLGGRRNSTIKDSVHGHISKMKYYPARVSDAQLQLLTQ